MPNIIQEIIKFKVDQNKLQIYKDSLKERFGNYASLTPHKLVNSVSNRYLRKKFGHSNKEISDSFDELNEIDYDTFYYNIITSSYNALAFGQSHDFNESLGFICCNNLEQHLKEQRFTAVPKEYYRVIGKSPFPTEIAITSTSDKVNNAIKVLYQMPGLIYKNIVICFFTKFRSLILC